MKVEEQSGTTGVKGVRGIQTGGENYRKGWRTLVTTINCFHLILESRSNQSVCSGYVQES